MTAAPNAGMTLVFRDDFKGAAGSPPDPSKWSVYTASYPAWERQPSQIALDGEPDGHVVIAAVNKGGTIVTGGMAAKLPAPLLYGYIEVRMYAVADPTGFTDAVALLWPDDGDWPAHGEIDYYEAGNAKRTVSSFLHYSAQNLFLYQALGIVGTGWHTVGVLWTAEDVVVYVDGEVAPGWNVKPTPAAAVPQWPMHPTLQLDVNPGTPAGAKLKRPVKMVVDYLAVWAPAVPAPAVAPPAPPAAYPLPAVYTRVTTAAELIAALAAGDANIVLADGMYDSAAGFTNAGSNVYAENLLGATLTAGMEATAACTIQGLSFSVTSLAKGGAYGWCVGIWDANAASAGAKVLDCAMNGNEVMIYGLWAGCAPNLEFERCQLQGFRSGVSNVGGLNHPVGARLEDAGSGLPAYTYTAVSDLSIANVASSPPGASNGTAEVGLWVGHPVTAGVQRVSVAGVSLASIETVNACTNTTFSDITIDMTGPNQASQWTVGVYHEHFSNNLVFEREQMVGVHTGHTCEWNDGTPGNQAVNNLTVKQAVIDAAGCTSPASSCGIYGDQGTNGIAADAVTFKNQAWAAIGAYLNEVTPVATDCVYEMAAGAVELSTNHI